MKWYAIHTHSYVCIDIANKTFKKREKLIEIIFHDYIHINVREKTDKEQDVAADDDEYHLAF